MSALCPMVCDVYSLLEIGDMKAVMIEVSHGYDYAHDLSPVTNAATSTRVRLGDMVVPKAYGLW